MRRIFLLFIMLIIGIPVLAQEAAPEEVSADSVEITTEAKTKISSKNNKSIGQPKVLLNEEEYKLEGKVEYDEFAEKIEDTEDENAVLFENEPVFGNIDPNKIKLKAPVFVGKESVLTEKGIFDKVEELNRPYNREIDEYMVTERFSTLEYKSGDFTYGTTFANEMDTAQLEYRTKIFTRYDNRYIGVMTALGKDQYTSSGRQMESIYFVPELKLGHGFVLLNAFKMNPSFERYRNQVILQYNPKIKQSRDLFNIEAVFAHTNYYTSGDHYYQFSLQTNFKL